MVSYTWWLISSSFFLYLIYSLLQHHTQLDARELKATLQSLVDAKLLLVESKVRFVTGCYGQEEKWRMGVI